MVPLNIFFSYLWIQLLPCRPEGHAASGESGYVILILHLRSFGFSNFVEVFTCSCSGAVFVSRIFAVCITLLDVWVVLFVFGQ
jgi:hypothetical protein